MKKVICLMVVLSFIFACKKKSESVGTVTYSISYTNSTAKSKEITDISPKSDADSLYTQYGDYIMSLTPDKLTAKFFRITFHDDKPLGPSGNTAGGGYCLSLINENMSDNAPERFADFTNNNCVTVTPVLGGDLSNGTVFSADEIHFIYMLAIFEYFYQEVDLPSQYDNINLAQFSGPDSLIVNHRLRANHYQLTNGIYSANGINSSVNLILFGNTDSSYVSTTEGNNPIWGNQGPAALRSNKYSELVFYKPQEGATFHINTDLSFNSKNLIQIYAGPDNIPFTSDDIFVYAPKWWDRLAVNVTTN